MAKAHKHDHDHDNDAVKSGGERDEKNKQRFVDQTGREASDLPNSGRPTGHNDTVMDIANRNLPQAHGGEQLDSDADDFTGRSEGGLRGDRQIGDVVRNAGGGGRGKN